MLQLASVVLAEKDVIFHAFVFCFCVWKKERKEDLFRQNLFEFNFQGSTLNWVEKKLLLMFFFSIIFLGQQKRKSI